jgi:hypothetical protein
MSALCVQRLAFLMRMLVCGSGLQRIDRFVIFKARRDCVWQAVMATLTQSASFGSKNAAQARGQTGS